MLIERGSYLCVTARHTRPATATMAATTNRYHSREKTSDSTIAVTMIPKMNPSSLIMALL